MRRGDDDDGLIIRLTEGSISVELWSASPVPDALRAPLCETVQNQMVAWNLPVEGIGWLEPAEAKQVVALSAVDKGRPSAVRDSSRGARRPSEVRAASEVASRLLLLSSRSRPLDTPLSMGPPLNGVRLALGASALFPSSLI